MAEGQSGRGKQTPSVGATWIVLERARQMTEEGWTPEHDDGHNLVEMLRAAENYLILAAAR